MKARYITMIGIAALMIGALMAGAVQALETEAGPTAIRATLENVRDYAPAVALDGASYAVDAGTLFAGGPGAWREVSTPDEILVSAVAVDNVRPHVVYIGAANELAIYRSADGGDNWLRVPMNNTPGGVTDIAVDGVQRIVYAGTDTAGVFRLRDVGSSMLVGGQLLLDEPVRQVAADSSGAGMAFARTDTALYRAENYGLAWSTVDDLHTSPTSLAIANGDPATVYVGTVDRGVLASADGGTWEMVNAGLGMVPGTRLHVDALAVDPMQPHQLYVAASFLYGSTTLHQTPSQVAISSNGAASWDRLDREFTTSVAELMPVSGTPGAFYALTTESRTPLALYDAPEMAAAPAMVKTPAIAGQPVEAVPTWATAPGAVESTGMDPIPLAWVIAALAALALGVVVTYDLHQRGVRPLSPGLALTALDTQTLPTVG